MKYMMLSKIMHRKLQCMYNEIGDFGWSHSMVQQYLGLNIGIRSMLSYCKGYGIKYDYGEKVWRRRRKRVTLAEKLNRLYDCGQSF
jgi:hypothetical protein